MFVLCVLHSKDKEDKRHSQDNQDKEGVQMKYREKKFLMESLEFFSDFILPVAL